MVETTWLVLAPECGLTMLVTSASVMLPSRDKRIPSKARKALGSITGACVILAASQGKVCLG